MEELEEIIVELKRINPWVMDEASVDRAIEIVIAKLEEIVE